MKRVIGLLSLEILDIHEAASVFNRVEFCFIPKRLNGIARCLTKVGLSHSNEVVWFDMF